MMLWHSLAPRRRLYLALLLMLLLNGALIGTRMVFTQSTSYAFLLWNLFLATIPFAVIVFARKLLLFEQTIPAFVLAAAGILFMPNAPYLITDLFHLRTTAAAPLWYDTIMIASCAATGLLLFYATMKKLEVMLLYMLPSGWRTSAMGGVALLCGYGIHLGRHERFNSWDIITNPGSLLQHVLASVRHPLLHMDVWGLTIIYSAFLLVTYLVYRLLQSPGYTMPDRH